MLGTPDADYDEDGSVSAQTSHLVESLVRTSAVGIHGSGQGTRTLCSSLYSFQQL